MDEFRVLIAVHLRDCGGANAIASDQMSAGRTRTDTTPADIHVFVNSQCVHQPFDDLDNGRAAAIDPNEFLSPRCVWGGPRKSTRRGSPYRTSNHCWSSCRLEADGDGQAASLSPRRRSGVGPVSGTRAAAHEPQAGVRNLHVAPSTLDFGSGARRAWSSGRTRDTDIASRRLTGPSGRQCNESDDRNE
jgi:hypothetical protein